MKNRDVFQKDPATRKRVKGCGKRQRREDKPCHGGTPLRVGDLRL